MEDNDLLPLDNSNAVTTVTEEKESDEESVVGVVDKAVVGVVALPDIVIPDDQDDATDIQSSLTPTITIEESESGDVIDTKELNGCDDTLLTSSQVSEFGEDSCDNDDDEGRQTIMKNYTVEDGFERPWENMMSTESVCGTDDINNDNNDDSDSDDETVDHKSSSSSSFPSESSGIFYKAEYTPPTVSTPINNFLSIENRDTYWRNFFAKSEAGHKTDEVNNLKKSQSGCDLNPAELPVKPSSMCKSKSDAKVCYSTVFSQTQLDDANSAVLPDNDPDTPELALDDQDNDTNEFRPVTNSFYDDDIEQEKQEEGFNEDHSLTTDVIKGRADIPPPLTSSDSLVQRNMKSPHKEEIFDQPWTEVGGDSPKQVDSKDNLTTTISQEMQDLLASIQSLGKPEEPFLRHHHKSPPRHNFKQKSPSPVKMHPDYSSRQREKNVNFESLMKEVEHQIRFSVTAELLERMTNCPSIENYFLSEVSDQSRLRSAQQPTTSSSSPENNEQSQEQGKEPWSRDARNDNSISCVSDTYQGTPPIPDLLQATVRQHPSSQVNKYSTPTTPSQSPPDYANRRFLNLPRPSDMSGVSRYQPTGNVPDMWSRVGRNEDSVSGDSTSATARSSRSEASGHYSDVCADLFKVKNDIDNLCDIINHSPGDNKKQESESSRYSDQSKIEMDLRDTRDVMKEIEHTVDSFRRHLSLPSGRVSFSFVKIFSVTCYSNIHFCNLIFNLTIFVD